MLMEGKFWRPHGLSCPGETVLSEAGCENAQVMGGGPPGIRHLLLSFFHNYLMKCDQLSVKSLINTKC